MIELAESLALKYWKPIALAIAIALVTGAVWLHFHRFHELEAEVKAADAREQAAQERASRLALAWTASDEKHTAELRDNLKKDADDFQALQARLAAAGPVHIVLPASVFDPIESGRALANAASPDSQGAERPAATAAATEIDPAALIQWESAYTECVRLWRSVRDKYNDARAAQQAQQ